MNTLHAHTPLPTVSSCVLDMIGNTPLLRLGFAPENATIFAKAEFLNPSGSIKDRLAKCILLDAQARGELTPDRIILECSSGNTGISLAMVGAALGVPVQILMSESASIERRLLMHHYGAKVQLFKPVKGYATGIELAERMASEDPRYFLPRQFANPLNAEDHYDNTGQEVIRQLGGPPDAFVSGYGTGGTINGMSRLFRSVNQDVEVVAMEPAEAAMLSGEMPCCHAIEGVAGGYVPPLLQAAKAQIDRIEKVTSSEAIGMARRLAQDFGLMVGTSSGANLTAALKSAQRLGPDAKVVTVLCDRAERYYSTALFTSTPAITSPS